MTLDFVTGLLMGASLVLAVGVVLFLGAMWYRSHARQGRWWCYSCEEYVKSRNGWVCDDCGNQVVEMREKPESEEYLWRCGRWVKK